MKVSGLGEFGLINRLAGRTATAIDPKWESARELVHGIGDDAAVWRPSNPFQIVTVDSLVEGVHFSLKTMTWRELGWKSIAVNLSDIAAMGGVPHYALVSLGLPEETDVRSVTQLYDGMIEMGSQFGVAIAGGDTVGSPFVFVSVTVIGSASNPEGRFMLRSAARPGQLVAVTNTLGASAAGLEMLKNGLKFKPRDMAVLRRAHYMPQPRIAEGQQLVGLGVRCGMDISDGLVGDLTHICEMSHVGARLNVDAMPVSPAARACFPSRALEFALGGGEDYELLFAAPSVVIKRVQKTLGCPVTVVGEVTRENAGRVKLVDGVGRRVNLKKAGWDHFG
jgi:thiamine-monophosphate kinase